MQPIEQTDTSEVIELLKSYRVCATQINAQKHARTFFDPYDRFQEWGIEECTEKMNFIKDLISKISPSDEATILGLHYMNGLSVDVCAECMFVSRMTAFRLFRKAIDSINKVYQDQKLLEQEDCCKKY